MSKSRFKVDEGRNSKVTLHTFHSDVTDLSNIELHCTIIQWMHLFVTVRSKNNLFLALLGDAHLVRTVERAKAPLVCFSGGLSKSLRLVDVGLELPRHQPSRAVVRIRCENILNMLRMLP